MMGDAVERTANPAGGTFCVSCACLRQERLLRCSRDQGPKSKAIVIVGVNLRQTCRNEINASDPTTREEALKLTGGGGYENHISWYPNSSFSANRKTRVKNI
jgi:hypothetical protein